MTIKIAFQIDEWHKINPKTDTSLALMQYYHAHDVEIFYYYPKTLATTVKNNTVDVFCSAYTFKNILQIDEIPQILSLTDVDAVFIRQDPPFDMSYITYLYFLSLIEHKTKIFNNPKSILNLPEKLSALATSSLHKYLPRTLITANLEQILEFKSQYNQIIIKPLYGFAGDGVFYLPQDDRNLFNIHAAYTKLYPNIPMICQEYIPAVQEADKRLIFINGKLEAYFARVQNNDSAISALRTGAKAVPCDLTKIDREIATHISVFAKEHNLLLIGADIIGEKLTEINVTCPTGLVTADKTLGTHTIQTLAVAALDQIKR